MFAQMMGNRTNHPLQRQLDRWGKANGFMTMGVEGTFDPSPPTVNSVCKYNAKKGVLSMNTYFETGQTGLESESAAQRELNYKLRSIVGAGRSGSLCVCTNGTRRRTAKDKGKPFRRFVNVEYYALCDRPEPDKVQEMAKVIRECLDNGCVQMRET